MGLSERERDVICMTKCKNRFGKGLSLSLIDILDYRRHLQRRTEGDKRSLVVSYYASVCKGGKEGGRTRRNTEDRGRRQADKQGELLLRDSSKMDSMTVTMAGHKARNGSRTLPGRFVPFVPPTRWKPDHMKTRGSQE